MNTSYSNSLTVYVTPEAEVITLNVEDLICVSQPESLDDAGDI